MSAYSKRTSANGNSLPPISPRLCSCDVHNGRFGVFKKAFEMLIDESACFKPLLADINAEYLGVITPFLIHHEKISDH